MKIATAFVVAPAILAPLLPQSPRDDPQAYDRPKADNNLKSCESASLYFVHIGSVAISLRFLAGLVRLFGYKIGCFAMNSKRMLLFATLLFGLAACSSRGQNGTLPQLASNERNGASAAARNAAGPACALVPSTVLSGFDASATQIAGASATDAWAVGSRSTFMHFNGSTWQRVPPPALPPPLSSENIVFDFVTPIASNDVWAGGLGFVSTHSTAFFVHWNGSAWKYIPSDPNLTNNYQVLAMAGDASNDVWAAVHNSGVSNSFERWDGTKWKGVFSAPNSGVGIEREMVVKGPNDVSAMLNLINEAVHWNGARVDVTQLPVSSGGPFNTSLGGTSNNDLWVSANVSNAAGSLSPYIQHRSTSWAAYNTSLVNGYTLEGVVDFRPGYALILATDRNGKAALLVYNGFVRWRPTVSPWPTGAFSVTTGQIVKGTTSFWASYALGFTSELGLVQCPSTPPAPL